METHKRLKSWRSVRGVGVGTGKNAEASAEEGVTAVTVKIEAANLATLLSPARGGSGGEPGLPAWEQPTSQPREHPPAELPRSGSVTTTPWGTSLQAWERSYSPASLSPPLRGPPGEPPRPGRVRASPRDQALIFFTEQPQRCNSPQLNKRCCKDNGYTLLFFFIYFLNLCILLHSVIHLRFIIFVHLCKKLRPFR